ncbi:MAG: MFS transporter [Actinomycetales bacterium]|nr:MFS transporter [Actinomycetales bacterium]
MAPVKKARPSAGAAPGQGDAAFPMRSVVIGVMLPALLFSIAVGVALPIIPTSATRLGADLATAGFVAALLPLGKILADVPSGALASRIGDRNAMVLAAGLGLFAFVGAATAQALWALQVSVLMLGVATAVFHLARHAYLTEVAPVDKRARVLSTLGGMHRLGYLIGPFLGALVIVSSSLGPAYWLASGCALATLVVLVAARPPAGERSRPAKASPPAPLLRIVGHHRRLLMTLGVATLLVGAMRGARQTVLPLWGEYLGLDPEVISLIFGLSGAFDVLLFYPAGKVMDSFGRLWIAVPSMLIMGVALAFLPLTDSVLTMSVAAGLLGLGNGLGSGIIMTVGADVAPPDGRSSFLGVWRLFQDTGDAAGPLIIVAGAALGSLAGGIWVAASIGLLSSAALSRWVPRFSVHANRTTRRRAGLG